MIPLTPAPGAEAIAAIVSSMSKLITVDYVWDFRNVEFEVHWALFDDVSTKWHLI